MGFSVAEARDMAGHSSTLVTDVYTHLSAKNLKAKMDRLEKGSKIQFIFLEFIKNKYKSNT